MPASKDERNRILQLVEAGLVTATQAGELFDVLEDSELEQMAVERKKERVIRIRTSYLKAGATTTSMMAAIPVRLVRLSLRLGARLYPQLDSNTLEDILRSVEEGATGRLLEIHDMERGERLEIFAE
ncbi:MAG TPA: hypothetical protein VH593_05010 [Ktedonobacteraceae bacterium]